MVFDLNIKKHFSPNCGPRKHSFPPSMIVLHYTAMENVVSAIERLCDPKFEVSAHYIISKDGEITQMVDESLRSWHAGKGTWGQVRDVNSHSIGIELDYCPSVYDELDFDCLQLQALEELLFDILNRRPEITAENIIGHSDMSPGRKFDPGRRFPWQTFAKKGLGVWPHKIASKAPDWDIFKHAAKIFGYCPPSNDKDGWSAVLYAFRLRFLPDQEGELSISDMGVIMSLAYNWPTHL